MHFFADNESMNQALLADNESMNQYKSIVNRGDGDGHPKKKFYSFI